MPKISIIIPAYNAAKTIAESIDSVCQQSFTDWELIVVNDGSTDDTLAILQQLDEPKLKIIDSPNGGVAIARNQGIALAQGEYLAFLDADDLWVENKLELQFQTLEDHPNAIAAYSWTCFMDEQKSGYVYHASSPYQYQGDVYPRLLEGDFIHSGSNVLVRRSAIEQVGGFDSACAGCEDWDMWLRLAAVGNYAVVPEYQVMYRRAAGSATSNVELMYKRALYTINKAFQTAPENLQYIRRHTEANLHMYIASLYLQHGSEQAPAQQAARHLGRSIRQYPLMLEQTYLWKLLIKLALRYILPGAWGRASFEKLRTIIATKDPRQENGQLS